VIFNLWPLIEASGLSKCKLSLDGCSPLDFLAIHYFEDDWEPSCVGGPPFDVRKACKTLMKDKSTVQYCTLEKFLGVQNIEIVLQNELDFVAPMALQAYVLTSALQPIKLGNDLTCCNRDYSGPLPEILAQLKADTDVVIAVVEVQPSLAWESAGNHFESFQKELIAKWRAAFMHNIQTGVDSGDLKKNKQLAAMDIAPAFQHLHQHLRSQAMDNDFEGSFLQIRHL